MVQAMQNLGWNRIGIIHEDNDYGRRLRDVLTSQLRKEGICISQTEALNVQSGISSQQLTKSVESIIMDQVYGIVFLGSASVASALLRTIDESDFSNYPVVMLSERSALRNDVYYGAGGAVLNRALGTLSISPQYINVPEYKNHWRSIFTDSAIFLNRSTANPWLRNVYNDVMECDAEPCTFTALTSEEFDQRFKFHKDDVYVYYAILAAHVIVKATQNVYTSICPQGQGTSPICIAFKERFTPGSIISALHNLTVDFKSDFSWR